MTVNPRTLNITNGDSAADTMREAGIPGSVLAWSDVLHDGPVPEGLDLDALAEVRASFLEQPPVAGRDRILEDLRARDRTLKNFRDYAQVVLWFEHDLYDQLQILQLLHWFSEQALGATRLAMICIDRFPGVTPFYGLGQLDAPQMRTLVDTAQPLTRQQLELGRRAWQAFTAADPSVLAALLNEDLSALPFLAAALQRHLEEFPHPRNGLSRHQRQILEMVDAGIRSPWQLFVGQQQREAAPYLGDWSFWGLLENLSNVPQPLLRTKSGEAFRRPPRVPNDERFNAQVLSLTDLGRAVLRGDVDWLALNPPGFWKGGVEFAPGKPVWRWDPERRTLLETASLRPPAPAP